MSSAVDRFIESSLYAAKRFLDEEKCLPPLVVGMKSEGDSKGDLLLAPVFWNNPQQKFEEYRDATAALILAGCDVLITINDAWMARIKEGEEIVRASKHENREEVLIVNVFRETIIRSITVPYTRISDLVVFGESQENDVDGVSGNIIDAVHTGIKTRKISNSRVLFELKRKEERREA